MGRIAIVIATERVVDEGAHALDVVCDPNGGNLVTASHFSACGEDAPPLNGDTAALEDSTGAGAEQVAGYIDTRNAGVAAPGEKRIYARDAAGSIVAEIHLKGSGSIRIENSAGGFLEIGDSGTVTINGVTIDSTGNIVAPGEVTAMAIAAPIALSKHTHATAAVGAPSPPIPYPPPPPEEP